MLIGRKQLKTSRVIQMAWETLKANSSKRTTKPSIGIQKNGRISWNEGTQEELGDPQFVELLLDRQGMRLGLKAGQQAEETFSVRKSGTQKTWGISAYGALNIASLVVEKAYRKYAKVEKGIVFIDISDIGKYQ